MPDIKNINVDDVLYDIKDETARSQIGDISALKTTAKDDLVSAINELKETTPAGGSGSSSVIWDAITDKPFHTIDGVETLDNDRLSILDYTPPVVTEILPVTKFEDFYFNSAYGCYVQDRNEDYSVTIGEEYDVSWDGVAYKCVAQDVSAIIPNCIGLGNVAAFQPSFSGNNEPFIIGIVVGSGGVLYASLTDTEPGGSHDIGISRTVCEAAYKIKPEYLPEWLGEGSSVTVLEEQEFTGFAADSDGGCTLFLTTTTEFTAGVSYIVVWDGTEYKTTAQYASSMGLEGAAFVGNGTAFGLTGNGEPFAILCVPGEGIAFRSLDSTAESHTIGIYQRVEEPSIPSFTTDDEGKVLSVKDGALSWEEASSLPSATTEDDGKVLQVVNGQPKWETLTVEESEAELPAVTDADNGKFLRVVNGVWAAESIPYAEEASF